MSEKAAKKKAPAKPAAKKKAPKAAAKADEPKQEPVQVVEAGPLPQARVMARHEYSSQERLAKGFSSGELSTVGLTFGIAKSLRVPIDLRRRSALEGNISVLKGWYKPEPKKPAAPKAEKKPRKEKPVKKTKKKSKKAQVA